MEEKRNAWDEKKFNEVLDRAGGVVRCSRGVMGIKHKKTGEMSTVLLFNDDNGNKFSYAFEFEDREMVAMLCSDLMSMANKIHRGMFGKK